MPVAAPSPSLTEWIVLALLVEQPRHGFALARELTVDAEVGRVWTVRRPLVYRALDRLVATGLAEPHSIEAGEGGPNRTVHRATPAGREAVAAWLAEPVAHIRDVRTELLAKLVLSRRAGVEVGPLLRAQRALLAPTVAALREAGATSGDEIVRWRRHSADAVDAFLAELAADASPHR